MKQLLFVTVLTLSLYAVRGDFSTLCSDGYYLKQTGRGSYCEPCPASCKLCTDFGECVTCNEGYMQGTAPACPKCDDKCSSCTKNGDRTVTCNKCLPGTFPVGSQCIVCPL